jgi:dihydrofolate synthase/folylpolyglutamate synthase
MRSWGRWLIQDMQAMVQRLLPLVEHWYFCDLPSPRAATAKQLHSLWQACSPAAKDRVRQVVQ